MSTQPPDYTHEEIQELLGAYALDAVDRGTEAIIELHLESCIRCSTEVAQHHEVAALLANSGGAPPAELWDGIARQLNWSTPPSWERLAERIASDDDPDELIDRTPDDRGDRGADSSDHGGIGRTVVPIKAERRSRPALGPAVGLVAAAAVVVAVLLGAQVDHLNHQMSALRTRPLLTQVEQAALASPSTEQVQLTALRSAGGSTPATHATIFLTTSGTGFVEAEGLASLPKTETYQLWGVIGGQKISLGLLGSDPTVVPFSLSGNVSVEAFAITAEHSGGVVQSRNPPVVEGEVTS